MASLTVPGPKVSTPGAGPSFTTDFPHPDTHLQVGPEFQFINLH